MKTRAILELLIATALWGFGFLATRWALASWGPLAMGAWRFGLAAILGTIGLLFLASRSRAAREAFREIGDKRLWKSAILPGVFLTGTLGLQTAGLQFTSITNSSFLTVFYVPIVPIIQWALFKIRATRLQIFCVFLGLAGTSLLTHFQGLEGFNRGDALTLGCAFMAAGHIVTVGLATVNLRSPLAFNIVQSGLASILSFLILPVFGESPLPAQVTQLAFLGMLFLVVMSSLIAFTLQVKAQRDLDATTASLIFLLEGPFASGFAFLILGELITPLQWAGAAVITLSAALASLSRPKPTN